MSRAIAWFVENPVAANLLMGLILVGGLVALPAIQQKTMPDMDIDIVQVSVEYLGAAPEEVESGVCIRIEEAVAGIEGMEWYLMWPMLALPGLVVGSFLFTVVTLALRWRRRPRRTEEVR